MADSSSNVKLPLMIDQSQIDSSMQKVEKSVLSAVTNINNQLKKTPLNLDIALNVNSKNIYDLLQKQLALKIEQSELPPPSVSAGGGSSGGPSAIEQYGGHLKGATADFARFVTGPLRATFSDFRSAVETLTGHITTMADIYNQADQDSNLLQKINATDSKDPQDYVQFYYTSGVYGNKSLTIANDVYRQQENIRSGLLRKDPASIDNYGDWSAIDQYSDPNHKILNQDKPGTRKEIGENINRAVVNIGKVKEEEDRIKAEAIVLQQAASKIKDKAEVLNFTDPDQSKKLMQQYAEKVKQYDQLILQYNQKDLEYSKAMDHVRQVSGYNTHIQAAYSDPNYSVNWDINGLSAKTKKDALEKNDGLSATVGNANNAIDSTKSKATANMSSQLTYYQELRMALNQRFPGLMALQHEAGAYGTSAMDKLGAIGQIAGLSAWIASQFKKNKDDDDDHKGDDPPSGSATGSKESSTAPVTKPDAAGSKGANPSAGWLTKEQVDAEIEYQRRHQGFGLGMSMSGSGKEMAFIGESTKIPKAQKDYLIKQLITGNLETIEYMPAGGVGGLAAKELGGVVAGQIAKKGLRTAIAGGAAATVGINMAKAQQRAGSIVPLNHETLSKDNVDSTISKINNFLASTQHKNTNQPFAVQGQRSLTPMADIMNSQRYNQMAQSVNNNNQQFTANITVNSNAMNNHALAQDIKQAVSSYFTQWQRTANNTDPHRIQSVVIGSGNG